MRKLAMTIEKRSADTPGPLVRLDGTMIEGTDKVLQPLFKTTKGAVVFDFHNVSMTNTVAILLPRLS